MKTLFLHYVSESSFDSSLYIVKFQVILNQKLYIFASNDFWL